MVRLRSTQFTPLSSLASRAARRAALLLGTSLLVYTAAPSAALAQNECGPPPPGGGTVTCPASGSPYINGIGYQNVVEDLTVVLQPGVLTNQTVEMTSTVTGVDLRLEGQANTFISSNQNNFNAGEGVNAISSLGTVFVGVDDVITTGTTAQGINAASRGGTEVIADLVSTLGENSRGVVATSSGSTGYLSGPVSVTTNAIVTQGNSSDGIIATAGGSKYGGGDVTVTSGILLTQGDDADGIIATANSGSKYGDAGSVTVTSSSLATTGPQSDGISATSEGASVTVTSGSLSTMGADSVGIIAASVGPSTSAEGAPQVNVTSASISTRGARSDGIVASSATGSVYVESGAVTTIGPDADGIVASSSAISVYVDSQSVTTGGVDSDGIVATASGSVAIESGTIETGAARSRGIVANSSYGAIDIGSGSIVTVDGAGIFARGPGAITIDSGTIATGGNDALGIEAIVFGTGDYFSAPISITSASVATTGENSEGIRASSFDAVTVNSGAVTTAGTDSGGIYAATVGGGIVSVTSTTVVTTGADSTGIAAFQIAGPPSPPPPPPPPSDLVATALGSNGGVSVSSGSVTTSLAGSVGIDARAEIGDVEIDSTGTVSTAGTGSIGIRGISTSSDGSVTIASASVTTSGSTSGGIVAVQGGATAPPPPPPPPPPLSADSITAQVIGVGPGVTIDSGSSSTAGIDSPAVSGTSADGFVQISSVSATTTEANSEGIIADAFTDVAIDSGSVSTSGADSTGILATAYYGYIDIQSTSVTTTMANSVGIDALANNGDVAVTSGTVTTTSVGAGSGGIVAIAYNGGNATVTSGTVSTAGTGATGIYAYAFGGNTTVTSTTVTTAGASSTGIRGVALIGSTTITSGNVTTTGAGSDGIAAYATDDVTATSTGTVRTSGLDADGIVATAADRVVVNSNIIITSGNNSAGIYATEIGGPGGGGGDAIIPLGAAVIEPNGGITITSGSITTSGSGSVGIDAFAVGGDIEITSTGAIATSGANSHGILSVTQAGITTLDVNGISVTGATADAIRVTSVGASAITVRGLVLATGGFEIQANGGAATVNTVSGGTIRGAIDLTDNADQVNNAGTFDAIGTSLFGAGADVFNNSGTTRSTNGAAVLAGLESFTSSNRVELRDGAVGDSLNVSGAFIGTGGSRLGVDVSLTAGVADVLITGPATGSTILDIALIGTPVFNSSGILVLDGTAGTSATALTLSGGATTNPYVRLGLRFDAAGNNILLVALPDRPVFESAMIGGMVADFWYQSADAVSAQLAAARDGVATADGITVSNLASGARLGGWIQMLAGRTERDATQTFAGGGAPTVFDVSYEQDYQGVQGGLDFQSGGTIVGVTFGVGLSDARFDASFNGLDLEGMNVGAYAAFQSGALFLNAVAKVDWIDVESVPGAGLATEFEATAWGLRGTAGFRFDLGGLYAEPAVSLSWVNADIDDYTSAGASISFDDFTSLRGSAGIRVGGDVSVGPGILSPFVGIHAVEEFEGEGRNDFMLGTTIGLFQDAPGTFGELSAGATLSSGSVEAFIRGEMDFGGEIEGLSGRAGLRLRF